MLALGVCWCLGNAVSGVREMLGAWERWVPGAAARLGVRIHPDPSVFSSSHHSTGEPRTPYVTEWG